MISHFALVYIEYYFSFYLLPLLVVYFLIAFDQPLSNEFYKPDPSAVAEAAAAAGAADGESPIRLRREGGSPYGLSEVP
jgi:hypothetical protein